MPMPDIPSHITGTDRPIFPSNDLAVVPSRNSGFQNDIGPPELEIYQECGKLSGSIIPIIAI